MLIPTSHMRIFLYGEAVDMRWGYDRLAGLCANGLGLKPYSGQMFLFINKAKDRARIFFYDGTGCCLFSKRLEVGRFQMVRTDGKALEIQASELMLLLGGHALPRRKDRPHWDPSEREY